MLTRSKLITFIIVAVVAMILAFVAAYFILFSGGGNGNDDSPPPPPSIVTLEMWGLFDDSDIYEPVIQAYEQANPKVRVLYKKFIWDDYESTLINAIASGRGPDIFMIHNTWMGKHQDKLAVAPENISYTFEPTPFKRQNEIFAFPLFLDNLALFYNKDLFTQEGFFEAPKTWEQFVEYSKALTRFSSAGALIKSGAALGTDSQTINRASDILLLMFLQNSIELFDTKTNTVSWDGDEQRLNAARDALRFYTDFADPSKDVYSWNEEQDYSIDAFWKGDLAMMFNYAYNIDTIQRKAPYLNFAVATLPQKLFPVSVENYWGLGVSKQSSYQQVAWDFLEFFSQDEQYISYINQTGRIGAKQPVFRSQESDPLLRPFIEQIRRGKTAYQPDEKRVQDILDELIRNVVSGQSTYDQALRLAADRLKLLLRE